MTFALLLADTCDLSTAASAVPLQVQVLQTSLGGDDVTVSFLPNRADDLYLSAKSAGQLAYRILFREGVVRSQLVLRLQLGPQAPQNIIGRSAELPFALAMLWQVYEENRPEASRTRSFPFVAATGVLEADGTVRRVEHLGSKLEAACAAFEQAPAIIFVPGENAGEIDLAGWSARHPKLQLRAIAHLDEALEDLGIVLERVYLRNPFRGLEHFDYEHRAIFFGRDAEIREVVEQLLRREAAGSPGLLVEGASGSGKSSFLRAGVLRALVHPSSQQADIQRALRLRPIGETVRRAIWRAGLLPPAADEAQLVRSIIHCWNCLPEFEGRLGSETLTLMDLVERRRQHWTSDRRFVWLLDQFEELFTLELSESVIENFGQFLIALQSDGVWTLASIRADAVPRLKQHQGLRQVFGSNEGNYFLATLSATALDDVINRPAQAAGLNFGMDGAGRRLDRTLREDAYQDSQNALPLLQFTLHELYLRRSGNELTCSAYEQLGGLTGSVATTADAIIKREPAADDRALSQVFRSLVSVDEAGRASRQYAPMAEITRDPAQKRLLLCLVEARLCVTDYREGQAAVGLAHEALLRTWPVLDEWLKQESGLLQTRELARRDTRLWQEHGRSDDWLATADKLIAFNRLNVAGLPLSDPVTTFIERSAWRVRRSTNIKRAAVCVITLLAFVASGASWIASRKKDEAEYQTAQALQAQARLLVQVAGQRLKQLDIRGAQGIILEVLKHAEFAQRHSPAAINIFQESRAADALIAMFVGHQDIVREACYSPDGAHIGTASNDGTARIWDAHSGVPVLILSGHQGALNSVVYSPDGTHIVTASSDNTARVWDAVTGAAGLVLSGHGDRVLSAAYSPDGLRIVTGSADHTARVWDARSGILLLTLSGHRDAVMNAVYSPDGTRIVTASVDQTARIWDAKTGAQVDVLSGHDRAVLRADYSPDGSRIVTASQDKTARIWDAHAGTQVRVLYGHSDFVEAAVYSPDGTHIATASKDSTLRIWDARTGSQLAVVSGQGARLQSAAYSPDGTRLVTAAMDTIARVWDARIGTQLTVLAGHAGSIGSARYSPDGRRILTASPDKTLRIWDAQMGKPLAVFGDSSAQFASADFSPDGTRIVSAAYDETARVWDANTGAQLAVLAGHGGDVLSAAYSPDGSRIVTASYDSTARIWDARTAKQLAILSGHKASVQWAVYSPDGNRIVTASLDGTARIWDASAGTQLVALVGHDGSLSSTAYSPDGTLIVTGSVDKTARIWRASTGEALLVLSGHEGAVESTAFSPDGTRVITASKDKTVRVWDAHTGEQLALLPGHDDVVETAAYSSDGRYIVSASDDKTARIWDGLVRVDLERQISWYEAAQTDPLSDLDRVQLGLPPDKRGRIWSARRSACDQTAGAVYDPDRVSNGVEAIRTTADAAVDACFAELKILSQSPRANYQLGRALMAKHNIAGAMKQFEIAVANGYRASGIDLADLLLEDPAHPEIARIIALYEKAWTERVPIAAYKLGRLYEMGMPSAAAGPQPDLHKAWFWYQQGADAGEPNALVRFAERDDRDAIAESDPSKWKALLLHAFRYYASAAERARDEDWPDEAWRNWRYRCATLARLLASEGMMQEVADVYVSLQKNKVAKADL